MRKIAKVSAATAVILLASAGAASADTSDEVPVNVQSGALTVAVSQAPSFAGAIGSKDFYGRAVLSSEETIDITDYRGTAAGYTVTQTITDVKYTADGEGTSTIQPSNFAVAGASGKSATGDTLTDNRNAPAVLPVAGGNLGDGQVVLQAAPGTTKGMGSFKMGLLISLTVPPTALAGDYTATLNTSVVSGNL